MDKAADEIRAAKTDKEEAGIKLGTLKAKTQTAVIGKTAEIAHSVDLKSFRQSDAAAGDKIESLRAQVKASEDSALSSHELGATADPGLVAKLAEAEASRDAMRSAIADAVNTERRKNDAFRKNLANTTGP